MLNVKIDKQIFNEDILDTQKKINLIKMDFKKFRKEILLHIDLLEKKIINDFKEDFLKSKILEKKKIFQNNRKNYFSDDLSFDKLKLVADSFYNFSKSVNDTPKLNFEKLLNDMKNKLKIFSSKFNKISKNFFDFMEDSKFKKDSKSKTKKNQKFKKTNKFRKKTKYFTNSDLIKFEDMEFVEKDLFDSKLKKTELLYKATRDGFKAKKFHLLCDKKGPTFSIIKSEKNKIFGGYISKSWHSKNIGNEFSENAFLFSLNEKKKFFNKERDKNSFNGNSDYLCIFGKGKDIIIYNDADINKTSYSNFGSSFEIPKDIVYESDDARNYLAGEIKFKVKEIEVYSVRLD